MNSTDIWCFFCSAAMRSRICFWIVTSSAVVGSSAISSFGSQAIAIAIITRCCWPPDICDGNLSMRRSGSGMPTSASSAMERLRAASPRSPMCRRSTSSSWKPTVNTGFSDVIGSWKIIEMSAPRNARSSRGLHADDVAAAEHDLARRVDDRVLRRQQAEDGQRRHRLAGAGFADQRDRRVLRNVERNALHGLERRVLVEPEGDAEVADADERIGRPSRWIHAQCRSSLPFEFRIERVAQRVGEEAERRDQRRHRDGRRDELPPLAEDQFVLRLVQHRAPRHDVHRHAEPQERQDHLGLDEADGQDRQLHQHDVRDVGKDVQEHPAAVRCADRVGRHHVFAPLVLQVFGADQAEHAGPAGEARGSARW